MVWDIDPVLIRIWSLEIRYYGLCFVGALLGGFYWWRWQLRRGGLSDEAAEGFLLPGAFAVVAGARLGHVLFYEADRFLADPLSILRVWEGGLASHGATIGLMAALWWFARKHKLSVLEVADRFSFSAAWGAALVRLGNFMNSEIVGRVTDVPWAVRFPRYDMVTDARYAVPRHPSQLYEFALGLFVLGSLVVIDRLCGGERRRRGVLAASFLVLYFSGRFLVEFFKEYQTLPTSVPLTMGQFLSIPFVLLGVAGLVVFGRKRVVK